MCNNCNRSHCGCGQSARSGCSGCGQSSHCGCGCGQNSRPACGCGCNGGNREMVANISLDDYQPFVMVPTSAFQEKEPNCGCCQDPCCW